MIKTFVVSAAVVFAASGAFAAVSPQYQEFAEGPAQYYMTDAEKNAWKSIRTDQEAERFIALFWARRDPTPMTPQNEFREGFEARVRIADENFEQGRTRGSMTDRGRVFITLGGATRRQRSGTSSERVSSIDTGLLENSAAASSRPTETWVYSGDQVPAFAPTRADVQVVFVDHYQNGEFRLNRGGRVDVGELMRRAAETAIVDGDLTWDELEARTTAAPAPVAPAAPAVRTTFATEALGSAVEAFRANPAATGNAYLTWGEYVTSDGDFFVPVQFYLPAPAGVAAGTDVTLFGEIRNDAGEVVQVIEQPVRALETKGDVYAAASIDLEPGRTYDAVFGLAQDGRTLVIKDAKLELAGIPAEGPSISQLILSENIYALTEAQNPTDPYSFGGIRVVPKSDRTFATSDELWYFFELRNPGLDAAGNPHVQTSIEVVGPTGDSPRTMRSPLAQATVEPLKGVDNHYGIGSSIPLSSFAPGEYSFTITVVDMNQKPARRWSLKDTFKVVAAE